MIKFAYLERSSKAWIDQSVVGRKKIAIDVRVLENEIGSGGIGINLTPVGDTYCLLSFTDLDSKASVLSSRWLNYTGMQILNAMNEKLHINFVHFSKNNVHQFSEVKKTKVVLLHSGIYTSQSCTTLNKCRQY